MSATQIELITELHHPRNGFQPGPCQENIDTCNFIELNYAPYEGNGNFLAGPTARTKAVWNRVTQLFGGKLRNGGVLAISTDGPSTITSHAPVYIDREN